MKKGLKPKPKAAKKPPGRLFKGDPDAVRGISSYRNLRTGGKLSDVQSKYLTSDHFKTSKDLQDRALAKHRGIKPQASGPDAARYKSEIAAGWKADDELTSRARAAQGPGYPHNVGWDSKAANAAFKPDAKPGDRFPGPGDVQRTAANENEFSDVMPPEVPRVTPMMSKKVNRGIRGGRNE